MGDMLRDPATANVIYQHNTRFGPGDPLREMAAVHKEFGVFSDQRSLRQAYRALHIVPEDFADRRKWFRFLDSLKDYTSDRNGVNGHDRWMQAIRENLESSQPLPMHMTTHLARDESRLTVKRGRAVPHENQDYIIVSIPTIPSGEAPRPSLPAARAKRAARRGSAS
jgi:hypothetical protein